MKLSKLLAGAAALAIAAGASSAAFADTPGVASVVFSLSGSVTSTCLINFSDTNVVIGNIPVNSVATAAYTSYFHMTNADAYNAPTNGFGGCNDLNTIVLQKGNGATGLEDSNTASFDQNEFTNVLPYLAEIGWSGPYGGFVHGAQPPVASGEPAGPTQGTSTPTTDNGAFASPMALYITVADPGKALLAGTYTDTITVTLTAI